MTSSYTSQVGLIFNKQGAFFVPASGLDQIKRIQEPHVPGVLEIFTHHHSLADAHRVYETARQTRSASLSTLSNLMSEMISDQAALLLVRQKVFLCTPDLFEKAYALMIDPQSSPQTVAKTSGIRDLTTMSKNMPFVAAALQTHVQAAHSEYPPLTLEQFRSLAERLTSESLLTIPIGAIDFGDFKRQIPFCPPFGNLRESPVDRYYLGKFNEAIRSEVKGSTLEIASSSHQKKFCVRSVMDHANEPQVYKWLYKHQI